MSSPAAVVMAGAFFSALASSEAGSDSRLLFVVASDILPPVLNQLSRVRFD